MTRSDRGYLQSPVPIFASYLTEGEESFDKWRNGDNPNCSSDVIHVDLDNKEAVGVMLEVYIARLLSEYKIMESIMKIQDQLRELSSSSPTSKQHKSQPNITLLLTLQAVQHFHQAIHAIYLKDFDKNQVAIDDPDPELIKIEILKKSTLDKGDHKRLLDTQLFTYLVENVASAKSKREDILF